MQLTINSKVLLSLLTTTGKVIPNKSAFPIVSCYRFVIANEMLTVTATDTENVLTASAEVNTDASAEFCVEAKRLVELLKAMGDCSLQLTLTEKKSLLIEYDKRKYSLPTQSAADFPNPVTNAQDVELTMQLPATSAVAAMDSVAYAMGTDILRPMMIGVLWDVRPNEVTFVATNTKVLAAYTDRNISGMSEGKFILPAKSVGLFKNMFSKEGYVSVIVTTSYILFASDKLSLCSVRVKGNYPDYTRVIPRDSSVQVLVDRLTFGNAIGRVSICANQLNPLIKLYVSDDALRVEASDINYNVSASEVVVCTANGGDLTVGLSASQLKDMLSAIDAKEVQMLLTNPSRPVVLRPTTTEKNVDILGLIMPMNIG